MHKYIMLFSVLLIVGLLVSSPIASVAAQDVDNDAILDSKEKQLALKYEPYLHFAAGEKFFPTDANYHIIK